MIAVHVVDIDGLRIGQLARNLIVEVAKRIDDRAVRDCQNIHPIAGIAMNIGRGPLPQVSLCVEQHPVDSEALREVDLPIHREPAATVNTCRRATAVDRDPSFAGNGRANSSGSLLTETGAIV